MWAAFPGRSLQTSQQIMQRKKRNCHGRRRQGPGRRQRDRRGHQSRVKESTGTLLGNDDMEREGGAQREKGRAQQEAAGKQEEAEQARRKAGEAESRERSQQ